MSRDRRKRFQRTGSTVVLLVLLFFLAAAGSTKNRMVTRVMYRTQGEVTAVLGTVDGKKAQEPDMGDGMKIALTFDDGPHPVYTPRLLQGLKERNVKATFFIVGKNAEDNPELVKRIREEGHLLGNHTYSHVQLTGMEEEDACRELVRASEVVERITGEHLEYVRPPFGSWNEELDCDIPMIPVFWSVDSRDWTTRNVSEIVRRVVTQTKEDDIILMHDYYSSSIDAALKIIDAMTAKGYEFVTADELIVK